MTSFEGKFEALQEAVARTKVRGEWSEIPTGKQFRCKDGAIVIWYTTTGTLQFQGKQPARDRFRDALLRELGEELETHSSVITEAAPPEARVRVFVVHGHDHVAREQLELILHKLGLEPYVLANTGGGGLTIIEALENEIGPGPNHARFGIVLMTPDDMGYAKADGPSKAEPRARQNVVLEMGMLIAALGRPSVAILKRGHVEQPSDANGILYLPFNDHVREIVPKLVDRLRAAGFNLDASNITKASS
jgi:predicted nucleotide-binding protein